MKTNKALQAEQTKWLNAYARRLWDSYCEIFPALVKFDCPTIKLNNRFTKTAGCNYQQENTIDLGAKFLTQFKNTMLSVILPHELAHQIDFNLYGESEKKCGHGKNWCIIMVKIGQEPKKYHSMELKK